MVFPQFRFPSLAATPISRRTALKFTSLLVASSLGAGILSQALPAQSQKKDVELTLVSFAVTKAAYNRIIPKFTQKWKQETGQNVRFRQSYGGSGSQTRAVIDGLEADVVHLALASDVSRIQKAGLIKPGWEKEVPQEGIVSRSVVGLMIRAGNPKGIKDWADLAKPGVRVITADPKTSGVAKWNFLGLWGSVTETGGSEAKAKEFVTKVYRNVPLLAKDAREATDIFLKQGQGDVLINYENEILLARSKGQALPFVLPQTNISIDNALAVVDKNVDKHGSRQVAQAFAKYLFTPEAQREFAAVGFRPADPAIAREFSNKFPKLKKLYTVKDLGGWSTVQSKFFDDKSFFDQMQASIRKR